MMPLWRRVRFGWVEGEERHYIARPRLSPAEFWAVPVELSVKPTAAVLSFRDPNRSKTG